MQGIKGWGGEYSRFTPVIENKLLAACGERTWLQVEELQMEGRKRLPARDFANGAHLSPVDRFGT